MIRKLEGYFMKDFSEKAGLITVLALFLLIPIYQVRVFFIFLLVTNMLPAEAQRKRLSSLSALPFSYNEIYWLSFTVLVSVVTVTQMIGSAIFGMTAASMAVNLVGSLIFATAYYGISMLSVVAGLDNFGIPLLVFIVDLIIGGIGSGYQNPYFYVSPIHQGYWLTSLAAAVALAATANYLFSRKGVQR